MCLYALKIGILDPLPNQTLKRFVKEICPYAKKNFPMVMEDLCRVWDITDSVKKGLEEVYSAYLAEQKQVPEAEGTEA